MWLMAESDLASTWAMVERGKEGRRSAVRDSQSAVCSSRLRLRLRSS